ARQRIFHAHPVQRTVVLPGRDCGGAVAYACCQSYIGNRGDRALGAVNRVRPAVGRGVTSMFDRISSAIVRNVIFPVWAMRDHPQYRRYRSENERTQWLSRTEIEALQLERLKKLVRHAFANVPFYRERMQAAGWNSGDVESLEQFRSLP